jgi:hypothetical protein
MILHAARQVDMVAILTPARECRLIGPRAGSPHTFWSLKLNCEGEALRQTRLIFGLAILTAFCHPLFAQSDTARDVQLQQRLQELQEIDLDTRLLANTDIPPGQRALIDFGGYFSPQYYSVDDSNNDNHGLRQYQLVAYLRANFDGANEIFLRGSTEYNDYNTGDSFDGFGSRLINPDFDRAYYRFDLQRYESAYEGKQINYDVNFEGGRDLVYWGNGLTMAEVVDGVMPTFSWGPLTLATVAGITPLRTVDIQPDRPEFDDNTKRCFYGAMLSVAIGSNHPYVYGLVQRDNNTENLSTTDGIITRYAYDSDYIGAGSTGSLTDHIHYGIEGTFECGNTLSNSSTISGFQLVQAEQTRDNIDAWAADAKVDYVPQDVYNSRITLEGIFATGCVNRGLTNTTFNGNAPNTPDRAFDAFGLVSTGLAFGAPVSNLAVMRVGASTFPFVLHEGFRRLQVGMDVYWFNKASAAAPIDEPTNNATYLGWEPDFYLNYEVLSDLTLTLRYGVFMPNAGAFPDDKARQFFYTGAIIAF